MKNNTTRLHRDVNESELLQSAIKLIAELLELCYSEVLFKLLQVAY